MLEKIHIFFSPDTTSDQWKLNVRDFARSLTVAILAGITTVAGESMSRGTFVLDWTTVWHTAAASAVAYLLKNFFTPAAPKS